MRVAGQMHLTKTDKWEESVREVRVWSTTCSAEPDLSVIVKPSVSVQEYPNPVTRGDIIYLTLMAIQNR